MSISILPNVWGRTNPSDIKILLQDTISHINKADVNVDRHEKYRPIYASIAYAFLPIFKEHPSGWNTIYRFPDSNAGIWEYLDEWKENSGNNDNRKFIACCIERLDMES